MRKILFIAIGVILSLVFFGRLAAERMSPDARADKARYYYMEGVRLQAEDKASEAYEMFKHARRIKPDYEEASSAYGMGRLFVENDTIQTPDAILESLEMMRPFVDRYPGDYEGATYYAYLAAQLNKPEEAIRIYRRTADLFPDRSMVLLWLADVYARVDSLDRVLECLEKYETIEGKSFALSSKKASYRLAQGDTIGAMNEAQSLIDYNPKGIEGYIMKGSVMNIALMPDSALYYYKLAESLDPNNGKTKVIIADFYRSREDSVKFDEYTYQALLSEDFDIEQKISILSDYLRSLIINKSDHSRGDYLFSVLSDQYPYEPQILDLAARYSYEKGDIKKALDLISTAIDLSPDVEDYYGSKMAYQVDMDDSRGAMETYHRAEKYIEPGEGVKFIFAAAASSAGEYDEAASVLQSLLEEIIPGAPVFDSVPINSQVRELDYTSLMRASVIYGMLGDMYYQAKEQDKSFGAYENAIRLMPYNYMTLNNYAYFLAQAGKDIEKAEKLSRQAVDSNPEASTFLDTYAYILFLKGEYIQALEYQEKALNHYPENEEKDPEIYEHLGDILFFLNRKDEAIENWQKALELSPENETLQKKVHQGVYIKE